MAQVTEEKLLEAIKKDDIKEFNALMKNAPCGAYRLGRFPVLSLLYLYKSKKIIKAFEEKFIKITEWEQLKEPAEIAKAFSDRAGKCLRLYLSEVVSPLEMLLILDDTKRLKRLYPAVKPSNGVKERLQSIYSMKYSLSVKYEGDAIIIDRRPLSTREKKRIATVVLCSFLAVAVAVATPVATISLMPKPVEGEVTEISQIKFSKNKTYTLKKDITVPASIAGNKMNCTIVGEGHKLIFEKGATFSELGGSISGAKIETAGSPLFSSVSDKGRISDITVKVNADIQTSKSSAFVAVINNGTIEGVTVSVSGSVSAVVESNEITFGGIALNNYAQTSLSYGTISNCTVNYSDFSLNGEPYANGAFGGIVGFNSGAVEGCKVTGTIESDTFDLSGVCVENYGLLSKDINEADLSQSSDDEGWNPIVSGIVYSSIGTVRDCENKGSLTAKSTGVSANEEYQLSVTVAGVVGINYMSSVFSTEYGVIECCKNSGAIAAEGKETVIVGGIVAHTGTPIGYCASSGDISAKGKILYLGGIAGRCEILFTNYWGFVTYCISESKISAEAEEESCVGGIVGFVREGAYSGFTGVGYFGGGVQNCIYLGECASEVSYCGAIVGVCGVDLYENNSYYSGNEEYHNFDNNYYLGTPSAFGAVVDDSGVFLSAATDKGASIIEGTVEDLELYQEILEKVGI